MWEVDPESKSKLLALQRIPTNTTCADCLAPSPQWASPKFGTFICLSCAGLHRGLGVHISFVRSITMDAFKEGEMKRMECGGNGAWQDFWVGKEGGEWKTKGLEPEDMQRRYGGATGEEWKERLTCRVEGREFAGVPERVKSRTATPAEARRSQGPTIGTGRKERNEAYFAKMGDANRERSGDVPPSQGGRYGGFGSEPAAQKQGNGMPSVDEFQKDPVKALTKGLGWFTSTVGKGVKGVNEGWIQPTAQKIAEADLAAQARVTAAHVAQNIQAGGKTAAERFNRFVDDEGEGVRMGEPEKKEFWDSFGSSPADGGGAKGSSLGTTAVRKGKDEWEDW